MSIRSAITGRFVKASTGRRWPRLTTKEKGAKYPRWEGDVVVLGPGVFVSSDGEVINWNGENYVRQSKARERG